MTIETVYFAAQILAAVAIVGTLLYGIAQLRINNRLARVQLTQQIGISLNEFYRDLSDSPEKSRIWRSGLRDEGELTPDEKTQFTLLCTAAFIGFEMQFRLSAEELVTRQFFDRGARQLEYIVAQPGIRRWWPKNRLNFNEDFISWVDGMIEKQAEGAEA